nr:metal-dependent transcriptional regulator [Lysinibacillus timonensis]
MISSSKDKYLWEIYTNLNEEGYTRVSQLAKSLQVSAPSVSKMAKKLSEEEYITFQRYGIITLTEKGLEIGKQLQEQHEYLVRLLRLMGIEDNQIQNELKNIEFCMSARLKNKIKEFVLNNS